MPDKYAQMDGGGSANRPNVKERQRQAAAKNRSVLRSGRTPARPKAGLPEALKELKRGAKKMLTLPGAGFRGAREFLDPTLSMPKNVKPKRKRK
jgi:hypothetical protein